ncbi:Uncharacterized protein OBRU01_07363 [Operophtera brumata]|uniref:Transmembrane protein n=1 Tax=Operophtera brumata TaxID=104452 RepID=A0A0L7LK78_OPEBR|nr:Uncharacterized protein OBRU01_07363 [Operophtera brumata]
MEDVYTIKVKTKPDTRNLYPSERRYSASTVSGLAWVHIALAATSFLLACLALVNPNSDDQTNQNSTVFTSNETANSTVIDVRTNNNFLLVLAPTLITVFGLGAGLASILASTRWYIDRNITWLFAMSTLSTLVSLTSFVLIAAWFVTTSEGDISDFYKDKIPFKDIIVVKHSDIINKNESHMVITLNNNSEEVETPHTFTKKVLSINILIAAFLELLWSILSIKISYKGMRNNYKDESNERRGNCISVITKIKGNDTKKLPRNGKISRPKPDLIEHYPSRKMRRLFLAQDDNGFYMKDQNKTKQNTDTSSEFYKERMMNFLNRCASLEGMSNPEIQNPSVNSEPALNTITEGIIDSETRKDCPTPISWGDSPDHTIYNQNTINFDKIFRFKSDEVGENNG